MLNVVRTLPAAASLVLAITTTAQFLPPQLVHPNAVVASTQASYLEDLNADGLPDILLHFFSGESDLGISFATGPGTFGPMQYLGDYPNISRVRVFDADADGDPDIVYSVTGSNQGILMLSNDGTGTFGPPSALIQPLIEFQYTFFLPLDVNQDGALDIIYRSGTANYTSYRIRLNDGAGSYNSSGSWSYPLNVSGPLDFATGDVDGDGRADLIGSYNGHLQLIRFDPTGQPIISYLVFQQYMRNYHGASIADVDGDGDADVIASVNEECELFLNNGDGSSWSIPIPIDLAPVKTYEGYLGFQDFDMDGDPDLIGADRSHNFFWFANDGSGQFGGGQRLWGTAYAEGSLFAQPLSEWWQFTDHNGDGHVDMLGRTARGIKFFRGTGSGGFEPPLDLFPEIHDRVHIFHGADLDGDGRKDVVVLSSGWELEWYRATGSNGFTGPYMIHQPYTTAYYEDALLDDMDGDGDVDVIGYEPQDSAAYMFPNNGDGSFAQRIAITAPGTKFFAVDAGDMDGDGDLDLVGRNDGISDAFIVINNGVGGFAAPYQIIGQPCDYDYTSDLDQDGRDELLLRLRSPAGGIVYAKFDEAGELAGVDTLLIPSFRSLGGITDIDGDDEEDLLYITGMESEYQFAKILVAPRTGPDLFGTPVGIHWDVQLDALHVRGLEDIDGDSDPDLLLLRERTNTDDLILLPGLGGGLFGEPQIIYSTSDDLYFEAFATEALGGSNVKDLVHVIDRRPVWYPNYSDQPYQVRGRFYQDLNANGVREPGEPPFPWAYAHTSPQIGSTIAWPNGEYVIYAFAGPVTVSGGGTLDPGIWQLSTPSQYTVDLTTDEPISLNNDFGFVPLIDTSIVRLDITPPWGPCSGSSSVSLQVFNEGTRIEQGTTEFRIEPPLTPNPWSFDPIPDQVSGYIPSWGLDELGIFTYRTYDGSLMIPSADFIFDPIQIQAFAYLEDEQGIPLDTAHAEWNSVVSCSYDPNDLLVSPAGYGVNGAVPHTTAFLDYTVRFQNTGNATAYTVELHDQLDEAFDLSHVQLLGFSHPPTQFFISEDRLLTVRFQNIMLPSLLDAGVASQGHVKFRLWLYEGLPVGSQILNTAEIYFDLNPPIVTNTTTNTLVDCALWQPVIDDAVGYELSVTAGDAYQWFLEGEPIGGATGQVIPVTATGAYTALVTSTDGCMSTTDPAVVLVLDASHSARNGFRVIPNPAKDVAYLLAPAGPAPLCVELADLHGRTLMTWTVTRSGPVPLHVGSLAAGAYLLRARSLEGEVLHFERLMVE